MPASWSTVLALVIGLSSKSLRWLTGEAGELPHSPFLTSALLAITVLQFRPATTIHFWRWYFVCSSEERRRQNRRDARRPFRRLSRNDDTLRTHTNELHYKLLSWTRIFTTLASLACPCSAPVPGPGPVLILPLHGSALFGICPSSVTVLSRPDPNSRPAQPCTVLILHWTYH